MFKALSYQHRKDNEYYYLLIDSEFTCEVVYSLCCPNPPEGAVMAVIVAREYINRNLWVAKNVAFSYLLYKNQGYEIRNWLERGKDWIDKNYPELNYGKKYYRCVVNQIKQLQFSKR